MAERFRAAADGKGSLVLIAGEPGVGKSRVVREFVETLQPQQALIGLGRCLAFAQSPYGPIVEGLRTLLGAQPKALQGAPDSLVRTLSRLLPELSETGNLGSDGEPDKRRVFDAIIETFRRIGATKPVVLALEDLHWADLATLELLQYVMTTIGSANLLIVATYRSDELHREHALRPVLARLQANPLVWEIAIEPLTDADMRLFFESTLEGRERLPDALTDVIRTRVEGNPLYAEELLKSAFEETAGGKMVSALPLTIRESVLERLGRFDERDRALLVCAAAIGERFQPDLLAEMSGRSPDEIVAALKRALDLQLIVDVSSEAVCYAFRHALTREAIYNELISAERRPLHARVARRLEEGPDASARIAELAYHWWAAHDLQKAAHYNVLAGDSAQKVYAWEDAARFYRRAVDSSRATGVEKAQLHDKLALCLFNSGHGRSARREHEIALAAFLEAGDTAAASTTCVELANLAGAQLDFNDAVQYAEQAVELAGERQPDNPSYVHAMLMKALLSLNRGEPQSALESLNSVPETAQSSDLRAATKWYSYRGYARALLDETVAAEKDSLQAEEIALAAPSEQAFELTMLAVTYTILAMSLCGNRDAAYRAVERLTGELAKHEDYRGYNYVVNLLFAAWSCFHFGDMPTARRFIDDASTVNIETVSVQLTYAYYGLRLGLRTKDPDLVARHESQAYLEEALSETRLMHVYPFVAYVEQYVARGQDARAHALLLRVLSKSDVSRLQGQECWLAVQAAMYGAKNELERARSLLTGNPSRLNRAHLLLFDAHVAARSGNREEALALATQSATLFGDLGWVWEQAQALELADQRAKALSIYRGMGDLYDAERLELALTPVNRRGRPKTALTTREKEIAALVAAGKSNRAIGEALYISERTVESHVSTIMEKLGVTSRVELAARVSANR